MNKPNYTVAPGAFIEEWLEDNDTTQDQLAKRVGVSAKHISCLLADNPDSLTPTVAHSLARVTGTTTEFWLRAEASYRADLERLAEDESLRTADMPLSSTVLRELRKRGLILHNMRNPVELFHELFAFFDVGNLDALKKALTPKKFAVAYRQGSKLTADSAAVMTWLRLGHHEAVQQRSVCEFDKQALQDAVPEIIDLTTHSAAQYGTSLVSILRRCGVHLLYVQDLPGTNTFGATWWMGESPVIQLSLRRPRDDTFWFTLMHEIGHLVLHTRSTSTPFVNFGEADGDKHEQEANGYATRTLIPPSLSDRLVSGISERDILDLSDEFNRAPGIIVGQCHHRQILPFNRGQRLIRGLKIKLSDDGV